MIVIGQQRKGIRWTQLPLHILQYTPFHELRSFDRLDEFSFCIIFCILDSNLIHSTAECINLFISNFESATLTAVITAPRAVYAQILQSILICNPRSRIEPHEHAIHITLGFDVVRRLKSPLDIKHNNRLTLNRSDVDLGRQRWATRVCKRIRNSILQCEKITAKPLNLARVGHAEQNPPAPAICEGNSRLNPLAGIDIRNFFKFQTI